MKNNEFDTFDESADETLPLLESVTTETPKSKSSQEMQRQAIRRRLDDLLEAKRLRADLNEQDQFVHHHDPYYDNDSFSDHYKPEEDDQV